MFEIFKIKYWGESFLGPVLAFSLNFYGTSWNLDTDSHFYIVAAALPSVHRALPRLVWGQS